MDDLLHAFRLYRRTPWQSLTAVVIVAVSIAFAASFFSFYQQLALQSTPGVSKADELVSLGLTDGEAVDPLPGAIVTQLVERSQSLDSLFAQRRHGNRDIEVNGRTQKDEIIGVSGDFFQGLGVNALEGRVLNPEDSAGEGDRVAVLSYRFWQETYDGDAAVIGSELLLEEQAFRIVGVADKAFSGMHGVDRPAAWVPLTAWVHATSPDLVDLLLNEVPLMAAARLAPGFTIQAAEEELSGLGEALSHEYPQAIQGRRFSLFHRLHPDPPQMQHAARQAGLLLGASVLLALIAAGNLGLFFLSQIPERRRELRIRAAVGASRPRLARMLLIESSGLVLLGGLIGLVLTLWLGPLLRALPLFADAEIGIGIDWTVFVFCLLVMMALAAVAAIAPALQIFGKGSLATQAREMRARAGRGQRAVISLQILVATLALASGLLFSQGLLENLRQDPGFVADQVTVVDLRLDVAGRFNPNTSAVFDVRRTVRDRLEPLTEIEAIGFSSAVPGGNEPSLHEVEPDTGEPLRARLAHASPSAFEVLSITPLYGTLPDAQDPEQVVVSRHFAESVWGNPADAVGRVVHAPPMLGGIFGGLSDEAHTVAAVIDDMAFTHPAETPRPALFLTYPGILDMANSILIRGDVSEQRLASILTPALRQADPPLKVLSVNTLSSTWQSTLAADISRSVLTGAAAALVVILAVLGFFGSLRFAAQSALPEYALRSALGAAPLRLWQQVMARGVLLGLFGLLPGLLLAIPALIWLQEAFDLSYLSIWPAALLTAMGLGALLIAAIFPTAQYVSRSEPAPLLRDG